MATRLERGGLVSYDPKQSARTTIRTGTTVSGSPRRRSSGGSSGRRRVERERARKAAETKRQAEAAAAKRQAELKAQAIADKLRNEMINARRSRDKSREAAAAVQLREQLKRVASARGRPFTQSESRKFLGGGAGVQALRSGAAAERAFFKKTGVSLSQQREKLRQQAELMKGVTVYKILAETLPSTKKGYVRVRFPNGKIEEVRSSGRININKAYAGEKIVIHNGQIIQVGEDSVNKVKVGTMDVYSKGSFLKGFQKVAVQPKFQSKEVRKEQEAKEKDWKALLDKIKSGKKINQTDIENMNKIVEKSRSPEAFIDKDIAKFSQITGGVVGTIVPGAQIPGAIMWAIGDGMEKVRSSASDGTKVTKKEFQKIVVDSATKGAIFGFLAKGVGSAGKLIGKRILTGAALRTLEKRAAIAALNHGGQVVRMVGFAGKNFITTYFLKDMVGNVFNITADVKSGRFNNAIRKAYETGGSIGGYIGGAKLAKGLTKGVLVVSGRYKATSPEHAQKKTQLDVMAKQLLSEGKIILTRRGVYEAGKGLSPRKDAWLDSKIKNPTNSIFWRFDKTLSKKDEAISPLPLFTKDKSGYYKMFKANWNKNKGMSPMKRYIKTTAETPMIEDVVIRQVVRLSGIKDIALRKRIIKEYATKGKLSPELQRRVLKNNFPISDKNREFGFHDENEFITRTGFKLKGRKDISWTYDPSINEYVPVVQSLKDAGRIKNFLSVLNKRKIITRTDAKFIADNYKIKTQFKESSILPHKHSYEHMKNVEKNIVKLMDKYPQFNPYWKRKYGSIANAKKALKQAMWHDIGKGESASKAFGTPHGEKVWRVWKAGLLVKGIKLNKSVALAIKKHETLDPRKLWYKIQNKVKLVSPEEKIVATADRLDLPRVNIKINPARLPLHDAMTRLGIKNNFKNYPSSYQSIINKIKIDKGVTKSDIKKLLSFGKTQTIKTTKIKTKQVIKKTKTSALYRTSQYKSYKSLQYKTSYKEGFNSGYKKTPTVNTKYKSKYKNTANAYISGYRDGRKRYRTDIRKRDTHRGRPTKRRPPKRPTTRPPKRPRKRPPKSPPRGRPTKRRPPKRPTTRPPKRPPRKPPVPTIKIPKGFTIKKLKKPVPVYYIKVKRKGRIVNLNPRPLTLSDSKDFLAHRLDKSLVRSGWFEPLGKTKNVVRLPKEMQGYFVRNKRKLRPYKVRVGKRKAIRNGYIERKKYVGDTKSELKQLQASRRKKVIKKRPVKRRKTRKRKPVKRKRNSKKK